MPLDIIPPDPIHLMLSVTDVRHRFRLRRPNLYAIVYRNDDSNRGQVINRTETLPSAVSGEFTTFIEENYVFEAVQNISVKVFDAPPNEKLDEEEDQKDDADPSFLGSAEFILATVMKSPKLVITLRLQKNGRDAGELHVRAETLVHTRDIFQINVAAEFAPRGIFNFQNFQAVITISRRNEDNTWTTVYRSSEVAGNANPVWKAASIPLTILNNGDNYRPLLLRVYKTRAAFQNQTPDGEISGNAESFLRDSGRAVPLIDRRTNEPIGTIRIACAVTGAPTLLEYISGGLDISLITAIDFTGSNGEPRNPRSLHFVHPIDRTKLNPYEESITNVGNVLQEYDTDKKYPVLGFGAKLVRNDGTQTEVQHCFNLHPNDEEVDGINGILDIYHSVFSRIVLSGPTHFAPIIRHATELSLAATTTPEVQKYFILLIITDGIINDLVETKKAIIEASRTPLSIIIVGVGNADFSEMRELDSDEKVLQYEAERWERDIVQFVPYNAVLAEGNAKLTELVLKEIPDQILQYFEKRGILPNRRI